MSKFTEYTFQLAAGAIIIMVYAGCTFEGAPVRSLPTPEEINEMWLSASPAEPMYAYRNTIYSDDIFQVQHGGTCAAGSSAVSADNAGNVSYGVSVEGNIPIPTAYDTATVFLNGWHLGYRGENHHVKGISTAIVDIEQDENELRWKAGGIMADKNGDDKFFWCYYYTALLWKSNPDGILEPYISAFPTDHDIDVGELIFTAHNFDNQAGGESLQAENNSKLGFNTSYPDGNGIRTAYPTLLPRGFGLMWNGDDTDHKVLQIALKYGDPSIISQGNGVGDLWWRFETTFKDDSAHHRYEAAEALSILEGASVGTMYADPVAFDIPPRKESSCPQVAGSFYEETIEIPNVPFDYAVPMLTGWDIGDACKDENVKEISVKIIDFEYVKSPDASTGTLTYTIQSSFDAKSSPGARLRHQVRILGLDRLISPLAPQYPTGGTTGTVAEDPASTISNANVNQVSTTVTISPASPPALGNNILKGTLQRDNLSR